MSTPATHPLTPAPTHATTPVPSSHALTWLLREGASWPSTRWVAQHPHSALGTIRRLTAALAAAVGAAPEGNRSPGEVAAAPQHPPADAFLVTGPYMSQPVALTDRAAAHDLARRGAHRTVTPLHQWPSLTLTPEPTAITDHTTARAAVRRVLREHGVPAPDGPFSPADNALVTALVNAAHPPTPADALTAPLHPSPPLLGD